jgi:hypothetical protein
MAEEKYLTQSMGKVKKVPKVKIKLSMCLTKHHAMKAYWESGGVAPNIH